MGPATRAVHAGEAAVLHPSPARRPAGGAIFQTAPFVFPSQHELEVSLAAGGHEAMYSREGNPTVRVAEEKLAALEDAEDAVAFASGLAAITTTLAALLRSGDRLVAARELYGGTASWLQWLTARQPEVVVERVPLAELVSRLADTAQPPPRGVYVETPSNPLLATVDLAALAQACRARGAWLAVDNTFATPLLQQPLTLGADVVLHSATKYLGGHSDLTAGLAAGSRDLMATLRHAMILNGGCLDPHAAFLLARGMKTLSLRVERQAATAARLAHFLANHPAVARVYYPGFDPVAQAQMSAGGGMLSCELRGGGAAAQAFVDRLQVFQIIPSLGGVESGASIPARTSHRRLSPAERADQGIADGLVRLSVGIEDPEDLEQDLSAALRRPG